MPLKDMLNSIISSVDGALAVVVLAGDGMQIDAATAAQAEFDLQLISAEYASILKEIRRAVEVVKAGELEEISITSTGARVLVQALNDGLFIALIMSSSGNVGKGRYLLRLNSFGLIRELS